MENSEIKEVMFDFDGTIADTVSSIIEYIKLNRENFGMDIPEITDEVVVEFKKMDPKEMMDAIGLSKLELLKFIKKYQDYIVEDITRLKMVPGMRETLGEIANTKTLGILSSNSHEVIDPFLEYYDLEIFEFVEAGATLWSKGTRLKKVLKMRDLSSSEIVYIGDEVKDVEASNRSGIPIISVDWGYNSKEKLEELNPGRVVSQPAEILEHL